MQSAGFTCFCQRIFAVSMFCTKRLVFPCVLLNREFYPHTSRLSIKSLQVKSWFPCIRKKQLEDYIYKKYIILYHDLAVPASLRSESNDLPREIAISIIAIISSAIPAASTYQNRVSTYVTTPNAPIIAPAAMK